MSDKYVFDCGCSFSFTDHDSSAKIPKINFDPNIKNINLECQKTWSLIGSGNTKGCFQLESRLGQSMAKKLKPSNIEQLSALIAILRPGCLEAMREGKSVSNHYIEKKNGLESIDYFHPSLEHILSTTYGEMIYQEQSMQIAQELAGFNLQEADVLRKAIGKKKPEEMAKLKSKFIDGCKKIGMVNASEAEEIFGWIEKSQRYSFNKSHSVSYAINAYLSAYAKAHFPKIFFASYLRFAKDKIDPKQEIKELVKNASQMDISVGVPDFRDKEPLFYLKNKQIYFGLTNIKGLGDAVFEKIISVCDNDTTLDLNIWMHVLVKLLPKINSVAAKNLLSSGAFDYFRMNRTEMLFQYELISSLTDKELEYINTKISEKSTITELIKLLMTKPKLTKKRIDVLQNILVTLDHPPYSLIDKIEWLSDTEETLLGTAISCSKLDSYDTNMTNSDCKSFLSDKGLTKNIIIAGEIDNINIVKTKKGKNPGQEMAFVSISDQYGSLDSIVFFPEKYAEYKHHLFANNVLIFIGNKNKDMDGLIVEKCFMPTT
jgi:DNA polymerase-3 subunit alpha